MGVEFGGRGREEAPAGNVPLPTNREGTFGDAQLVVEGFGYDNGWRVDRHPRFVADLTGDGKADLVGFGNNGVRVARAIGGGLYEAPGLITKHFGYGGWWRTERHPILLGDTTRNRRADIVGFHDDGVWIRRV
ncbi:FG-GAP repeat domain-containing protein [Nonomuraea lactucae]|uniref:FG-GAP repeat domain-containing protein n=1 Tax=Nonomuraea lactucae TaxID=2249762 RepID=UPI000DE44D7F|nr:VCBS repeat-containing protein [Nonomuraea lactucae]